MSSRIVTSRVMAEQRVGRGGAHLMEKDDDDDLVHPGITCIYIDISRVTVRLLCN